MSAQAGNLHWRRAHLTLASGPNNVDTLLSIPAPGYGPLEPPLGVTSATPPPAGTSPASRIQIIPCPPMGPWGSILSMGEPYLDTDTNTIHVTMLNGSELAVTVNVLFWNPHTIVSPGNADTYNTPL